MLDELWPWPLPEKRASTIQEAVDIVAALDWMINLNEDTGGRGLCTYISSYFLEYLLACGLLEGEDWALEGFDLVPSQWYGGRLKPHPLYLEKFDAEAWPINTAWHQVLRVGRTVYDFTARQFSDELPYPFVWEVS